MELFIQGKPQGKARPRGRRLRTKLGKEIVNMYTPKKTHDYEGKIAEAYTTAPNKEAYIDGEPVSVEITALFAIPESYSRAKKREVKLGMLQPTKKPDIDNIIKIVMDGLNGLAYKDDKQVVRVSATKAYTSGSEGVAIKLKEYKL